MTNTTILSEVSDYYIDKLIRYGETPKGVDWNGEESQLLRFIQLTKIIETTEPFSLNDLGCGYGALFKYLKNNHQNFEYYGCDIASAMIDAATARYSDYDDAHFKISNKPENTVDYSVASGIFNVRLKYGDAEWQNYLMDMLNILNECSKKGFSFNCLTSHSDADRMRDYLYYADPCWLFDLCKKRYSRNVALLHDYDLYEFTILVRK